MERWLEGHENDARAALALAGLLQEAGREADALLLYEQVLRLEAENVVALNNAAWLYHETGDARALPLAVKARTVAGDNPAVLDTLGVILMAQNREEDAVAYLEMAARLAPEMPEIRYHLAQAQVATGRVTEARETLVSLVTAERPFPQRASAQELLESL
jgi:Flp pilus assembly protein TadD